MKYFKTTSLAILSVMLFFASCSIEKRVHMSGYHARWHKSNHGSDKQDLTIVESGTNTKSRQISLKTIKEPLTNTIYSKSDVSDDKTVLSLDNSYSSHNTNKQTIKTVKNKDGITPLEKTVVFDKKINTVSNKSNPSLKKKDIYSSKNKLKEIKASNSSNDGDGSGALRVIGWIVLILGILILLLVSILVGAILMLLGLVFVIAGGKKNSTSSKSDSKTDNSKYIDVVYLKNGSVIRGMIIEQTPNVSLKIQTKDGSIFVYKMEEVEKMTKELENK